MKAALALSVQLRAAGLRVDLVPKATQPGKLRKQADDQGIGAAVWLESGRTTLWRKSDGATLKDLTPDALAQALQPVASTAGGE
jgi:hypothetical protein